MEPEIKKKLCRNWFKILQDVICREIEQIEKKQKFKSKTWFRGKKMKAVVNIVS